jgi:hypothetical protein
MQDKQTSNPSPRPPQDFAEVLASEPPLFLVGGQAVNLWALYYLKYTSDLSPFVSRDADILGNRNTVYKIAGEAGVKSQFFPLTPPTNEIGVVIASNIDGESLPVEVLSSIHGIKNKELENPQYTMALGESGILVKVPGPIALLKAKIANSVDLNQTGRQDERHVSILARLMPAYLVDLQASLDAGRITEREMIDLLENLLKIITTTKAVKLFEKLNISGLKFFSQLKPDLQSKLHSFITKRLPRILPKLPK